MRRKIVAAAFAFAVALLASCTYERNNFAGTSQNNAEANEWTVMYYGPGETDSDLTGPGGSFTRFNLSELEQIPGNESVTVVALTKSRADESGNAKYSNVTYHPGAGIQSTGDTWGPVNLSDPATLRRFIDSAVTAHPARKYAMVVTGGGDGWRGVCEEENARMFIQQFGGVFQNAGIRFEVVALLLPETGMIEVGYELHDAVNYLVVPSYPSNPAPYFSGRRWLNDLIHQPGASGERFAKLMVDAFHQTALERRDTALFSMVDLSQLAALADEINRLAEHMRSAVPGNSQRMFAMRRESWNAQFDDSTTVDISKFVTRIQNDTTLTNSDPEIAEHCRNIQTIIAAVSVYHRPNGEDRFASSPSYYDAERCGLSVYFPTIAGAIAELPVYATTRFGSENPHWAQFVDYFNTYELQNGIVLSGSVKLIHTSSSGFRELYVLLDTTTQQRPQPYRMFRLPIAATDLQRMNDTTVASFSTRITLEPGVESLRTRLFVYQDMDRDENLSVGDPYGFHYTTSRFRPDTLRIAPSDSILNTRYVLSWQF